MIKTFVNKQLFAPIVFSLKYCLVFRGERFVQLTCWGGVKCVLNAGIVLNMKLKQLFFGLVVLSLAGFSSAKQKVAAGGGVLSSVGESTEIAMLAGKDPRGLRNEDKSLMYTSRRGGGTRRMLRKRMGRINVSILYAERDARALWKKVTSFTSRQKMKFDLKLLKEEANQMLLAQARADKSDESYDAPKVFNDARKKFGAGAVDFLWDYYFFPYPMIAGWFRKNYRNNSEMKAKMDVFFKRLAAVRLSVTCSRILLARLLDAKNIDAERTSALKQSLEGVKYKSSMSNKILSAHKKMLSQYADGETSTVIPLWEMTYDLVDTTKDYVSALQDVFTEAEDIF